MPNKPGFKKNEPSKPPARGEKQYELVQLWRKRDFPYADPNDATDDEIATAKYRALVTFILLKIPNGFNMDGTPRYKVSQLNLTDSAHPKMLTRRHGSDVVESRHGIALSSFRIPAKKDEVVKALYEDPLCWQPNSVDPWKADKNGKGFYIREISDLSETRSATERAITSDDKAPTMESSRIPGDFYQEDLDPVFEDSDVEELVA